ncbi:MAG TPA: hypothetical protein VGB73_17620 [Pyrinomonadaceae bacterium]|jgi:hypothetical protein
MKPARLTKLARALFLLFGLSTLAYSAVTTRLPERLVPARRPSQAMSSRPVFIEGIVSIGGLALNVAFASDGKPVCLSLTTEKQG